MFNCLLFVSQRGKYLTLLHILLMPKDQSFLLSVYLNLCTQTLEVFSCYPSNPLLILSNLRDLTRLKTAFSVRSNAPDKTDLKTMNVDLNQLLLNMRLYKIMLFLMLSTESLTYYMRLNVMIQNS